MNTNQISDNLEAVIRFLDKPDIEKADKFLKENDRLLSLGGSYLIKRFVGGQIKKNPFGKPHSEKAFFNISHSVDLVGIAVSNGGEVGLDIEKDREHTDDVKKFCLSDEEFRLMEEMGFLIQFVSKESLVKAEGSGLPDNIKSVPSLPLNGRVGFKNKEYHRHTINKNGYFISVSKEGEDFEILTEELHGIG